MSSQTAEPIGGGAVGESVLHGVNSAIKTGAITMAICRPDPEGEAHAPREGADMLCPRAADLQRNVVSQPEKVGMLAAELEDPPGDEQLEPRVARVLGKLTGKGEQRPIVAADVLAEPRQHLSAQGKIDRPAVVRVDEAEIPELLALINVRHARRGQLQESLRQGAVEAPIHDLLVKAAEFRQESVLGMVVEHGGDELADRGVIFRIGIDPTRVDLRLVGGLFHVRRHAIGQLAEVLAVGRAPAAKRRPGSGRRDIRRCGWGPVGRPPRGDAGGSDAPSDSRPCATDAGFPKAR